MDLTIPDFCLVAVVALHEAEAEDFLRQHFTPDEVVRAPSPDWPEVVSQKLACRELVAIDASRMSSADRTDLLRCAKKAYARGVAIVIADRGKFGAQATRGLERLGVRTVHAVRLEDVLQVRMARERLPVDLRHEHGPFDIIGDVHGCADELELLLARLGFRVVFEGEGASRVAHVEAPAGRRAIFVGDFIDRGPRSPDVMRIVMALTERGAALSVPGNHDAKFLRWLYGNNVQLTHGLDRTVRQFLAEGVPFRHQVRDFLTRLPNHLWLEGGRLVVAHAGIKENMIGHNAHGVREFCLYGDTDGDKDDAGLAIRYHWAADYSGETTVVYGHTPLAKVAWVNNTLCVDTGCCFGGALTALRWPEREAVSVPAKEAYATRGRPFGHPALRPRESDQ